MSNINNRYVRTFTGKKFHFIDPVPSEIDIEDIARGLSKLCRYVGQIENHYSVAEHSVEVMHLVPDEFKIHALLHDASEAYLSDIAHPVKQALEEYRRLENWATDAVIDTFHLHWGLEAERTVKRADVFMGKVEFLRFHGPEAYREDYNEDPSPEVLSFSRPLGLRHDHAYLQFIRAFKELTQWLN